MSFISNVTANEFENILRKENVDFNRISNGTLVYSFKTRLNMRIQVSFYISPSNSGDFESLRVYYGKFNSYIMGNILNVTTDDEGNMKFNIEYGNPYSIQNSDINIGIPIKIL